MAHGQFNTSGIVCMIIIQAARDVDTSAVTAAYQFRRKNIFSVYAWLSRDCWFPSSISEEELDAVLGRIAAEKLTPIYEDDTLTCHCCFARRCLLPYRHVFHLDSGVKV